jgi:hypothetical protein
MNQLRGIINITDRVWIIYRLIALQFRPALYFFHWLNTVQKSKRQQLYLTACSWPWSNFVEIKLFIESDNSPPAPKNKIKKLTNIKTCISLNPCMWSMIILTQDVCFVFKRCFGKKIKRFFFKLLFFIFLDRFDMLILKINFKKYK